MKNANTAIIIPVYNEASVVAQTIAEIKRHFDNVICVNDGSTDESSARIEEAGAILIEHPINLGAGAATQTGIDYALQEDKTGYFVTIDADGQHEIGDAVKMLQHLKKHKLDVTFGSRFLGQVQNISIPKRLFLKAAAIFSDKTSGVKLTDPHIGLRVFNRKFAENLKLTLPDFTHASEIIYRVADGDYKYDEVPINVKYTDYSKSKGQPMLNSINIVFDLFVHRMTKK
jgi:glycosyltransferase involved in cell wall biosynthesis